LKLMSKYFVTEFAKSMERIVERRGPIQTLVISEFKRKNVEGGSVTPDLVISG